MIINKITVGFVVQKYDTETGKCFQQDFIAGDQIEYEDEYGDPIAIGSQEANDLYPKLNVTRFLYQPFDMVQPEE